MQQRSRFTVNSGPDGRDIGAAATPQLQTAQKFDRRVATV
jgi:hypothetical protein